MEFTERKRVFILVGLVAVLLTVVMVLVIAVLLNRKETSENPSSSNQIGETPVFSNDNQDAENQIQELPPPPPAGVLPPEPAGERYTRQVAKIFLERFQSYSSHNDNQHLDDVESLVTAQMWSWIQTQSVAQTREYQGVTSRVISSSVSEFTENSTAVVQVGVQQIIEDQDGMRTAYKNGRVELLFDGGQWKVDGLYWDDN